MLEFLAYLLTFIVNPCYALLGNWWLAILLFTIIIKILLMPMSLWCQKNSIVMVQLMPELNRIKAKYFGDRESISEKQNQLYHEKHYHPLLSLVPLAVQVLILFGLVDVIHGITDYGAPGTALLGMVPVADGGISWFMPLAAGLSAVIMGYAQNRINPLQREQTTAEKNLTNGLSIGLSLILGVFVAQGMGFYWVCSNLTSIGIQALCNVIIKPAKYIDYEALVESRAELSRIDSLDADRAKKWYQSDPLAKREKADYRRFFHVVNKHLVFYSEKSGYYKYYQGAIEWLLANSDVTIHYVTNDPDDRIFELARVQPRIRPYYIGPKRIITLMMKMDAAFVVMTLEELDNYYIKRSYVDKDTRYIYMFHHMTSTHMTAHKGAYDNYDDLLCVGQHQIDELRRNAELHDVRKQNLIPCGYDLLDRDIAAYEKMEARGGQNARPTILIAPSWNDDNLLDLCIDDILSRLLGHGWRVIVRPHPEYTKRYRPRWEALLARYGDVEAEELYFERDFSSDETIFTSDLLITDWSSVAYEFSFSTKKPTIFIDTPMRVGNPDYEEFGIEPTDISLRNEVGVSLPPDDLSALTDTASAMLSDPASWREKITRVTERTVFNLGHAGEVAGEYILEQILQAQDTQGGDGDDAA